MRRTQNVSKRIAVAILAASMAITPVAASVTCPMVVFAGVVNDNPENGVVNVSADGIMNQNNGTVTNNLGTVVENNDTVTNNLGTVKINNEIVTNNLGTIEENNCIITNNFGTVIENNVSITNNYAGTVNDGDGNGTVANQFYTVSVSFSNTSSSYGEGFTDSPIDNDTNHYIKVTSNGGHIDSRGTITIAPSEGYHLDSENSDNNPGYRYTLEKSGNNYVLTIINPEGSVSIVDPQTIGLVVQGIQQANPEPDSANPEPYRQYVPEPKFPSAEALDCISQTAVNINSTASSAEIAPAPASTSVGLTHSEIRDIIDIYRNTNENVVDIDLGNEPSLTINHLIALLENTEQRDLFAKRCHFTHKGRRYVLFVPANLDDKIPELFNELYHEPNHQAGPMRLAQLFLKFGFELSEE
ncbi:MAG: hypothetical protein K6G12_02640 [Lachnospiraceae bacterium]|nr:hypothetical protein [Lachnospiraceae bacterium]